MYRFFKFVTIGLIMPACILAARPALAAGTRLLQSPHYSGGNIVFSYMGDIWLQPAGDAARPLTSHPGTDIRPRFSPDGKWIVFISNRTGNWDVFVVPATGGMPRQLTYYSGTDVSITWTTDSKRIIFRTGRGSTWGSQLYTVAVEGEKMPEPYLATRAYDGTFSADGRLLAYTQRSASYGRRGYVGSANAKIHICDTEKKTVRRLLDTDRHENSPMIAGDKVYFVCERDGVFNIWCVPVAGGEPEKVTNLPENGVTNPSISPDGEVILFEHEFNIWKLDVKTGKASEVPIKIEADYREQPVSYRKFGKCDDYDVSPDETRVVISTHGEIFTLPIDKGRVVQITDGPARDRKPAYSPDGKKIAFISDRTKQDEVYVVDADGKNLVKVTDSDTRKYEFDWSPDGKHISVSRSDNTLWVYNLEEKSGRLLLKYKETAPRGIYWSPDGRWIAFLKANKDLEYDACIISAIDNSTAGAVEHVIVENLPFDEWIVAFTKEKLFFLSSTELEGTNHLYAVSLAREAEDPDDPEVKAARAKKKPGAKKPPAAKPKKKEKGEGEKPGSEKPGDEKPEKKEEKKKEIKLPEVKIDFDRIEKRVRKLFEVKGELKSAAVSPDGKKIVAVVTEPVADEEKDNLYLFDPEAEKSKFKKIGSVKEVSSLGFSPKGKEIFYLSGGRLYHRAPGPGSPKPVAVSVKVKVDTAKEFEQIFHECWRMLKHAFYDPDMHEVDWEAMRDKYAAVLPSVTDRDALGTVINRMLGELKASHMGYYAPREPSSGVSTLSFGLELEADAESGLYRIGHIYEYGPALKDWANVSEGDYLFAVDGKPLAAGDNYHRMLNHPLNDRLDLTVGPNADGSDNRSTRIKLIGSTGLWRLRYRKWVDDNRRRVEERSGGRLAYTHILSMSRPYLEQFKRELMQYRQKEGVVIDVRNNGGGYIDVYLLDFLEKKKYGYRTYNREAVKIDRPRHGFYGPKVVLTNEYSFSNAEIFPRGFRDLGLGKLIGIKTGGGVIGTSSYTLIDGSRIRTPVVGAYARDGTNLENWGVNPDIKIDRTPEDDLAGRYPQLDGAIDELLKSLPAERQK